MYKKKTCVHAFLTLGLLKSISKTFSVTHSTKYPCCYVKILGKDYYAIKIKS